jgi:hypothetical protein
VTFSYEATICWHSTQKYHEIGGATAVGIAKQFLALWENALVELEVSGDAGEGGECVVRDDGFEDGEGLGGALAGFHCLPFLERNIRRFERFF